MSIIFKNPLFIARKLIFISLLISINSNVTILCAMDNQFLLQGPPPSSCKNTLVHMLNHTTQPNGPDGQLLTAARTGNISLAKKALENGTTLHTSDQSTSYSYLNPLYIATKNNHTEMVQLLLKAKADIDNKNNQTQRILPTLLEWAINDQNPQAIALLIKHKANVNRPNSINITPLAQVVEGHYSYMDEIQENATIVRMLCFSGAVIPDTYIINTNPLTNQLTLVIHKASKEIQKETQPLNYVRTNYRLYKKTHPHVTIKELAPHALSPLYPKKLSPEYELLNESLKREWLRIQEELEINELLEKSFLPVSNIVEIVDGYAYPQPLGLSAPESMLSIAPSMASCAQAEERDEDVKEEAQDRISCHACSLESPLGTETCPACTAILPNQNGFYD